MLSAALLSFALCIAHQSPPGDLDHYLQQEIARKGCPSLSVAVVKNGRVDYAKAFGYADLENDVQATPDTVYRLGSITKQFTATMVMQLVKEGKLSLDATVAQLLPELPKGWAPITVRQLLSHTSGIKNYTSVPKLFDGPAMQPTTPIGILKPVWDAPLDFPPGSQWSYSNSGYEVLGMIVEKLDKRPYGQSLHARLLDPLGMKDTYFTSERTIVKHRAQGYDGGGPNGFLHAPYLNMDWPYAAGSMESTTLDLSKWDAALYGDTVLPQAVLKQMWTPIVTKDKKPSKYGFGWQLDNLNGADLIFHGGGIHGFTTMIRRAPSMGLTVIVLCNDGDFDTGKVAVDVMGMVEPKLKVQPPKPIEDHDPAATLLARQLVESIQSGKRDHNLFTPEFDKMITPAMEQGAQQMLTSAGPIKKFALIEEHKDANGTTTRIYLGTLGTAEMRFAVTVNASGKVAGLEIH